MFVTNIYLEKCQPRTKLLKGGMTIVVSQFKSFHIVSIYFKTSYVRITVPQILYHMYGTELSEQWQTQTQLQAKDKYVLESYLYVSLFPGAYTQCRLRTHQSHLFDQAKVKPK